MPIVIPQDNTPQFVTLRKAIADTLKLITEGRVYPNWVMQYEIGDTVSYLKKNGKVNAWMIMTTGITPSYERVGGNHLDASVKIRVWAFRGYDYSNDEGNNQDEFEKELWNAIKILFLNRGQFALEYDFPDTIKFMPLRFDDIEAYGFDGTSVMLARGEIEVTWGEQINQQ